MSGSLSNKELVAVGHQFAKAMSSDTPIMDMAKMFTRLAERLDCTTTALGEMTKLRDVLAKAWDAQRGHINQQADRIESLESKNSGLGKALGAAEKRVAELEAREVVLTGRYDIHEMSRNPFESYRCIEPDADGDYLRRDDVIEALAAAGISIKGE